MEENREWSVDICFTSTVSQLAFIHSSRHSAPFFPFFPFPSPFFSVHVQFLSLLPLILK